MGHVYGKAIEKTVERSVKGKELKDIIRDRFAHTYQEFSYGKGPKHSRDNT